MRAMIVCCSYHLNNTCKVAMAMAEVLGCDVKRPAEVGPVELAGYDVVGFASGIYSAKHHDSVLDLAQGLPKGA